MSGPEQGIPDWKYQEPLEDTIPLKSVMHSHTDCARGKHSFRRSRPGDLTYRNGVCSKCGANPVDWPRLDKMDIDDSRYTIQSLNFEYYRYRYWTADVDASAVRLAQKKGLTGLQEWIPRRLDQSVRSPSSQLFRDGTQTSKEGNVVFYGQHATGTCCRKCMEEWHGMDRNQALNRERIQYFSDLILLYVKDRLPGLR
jgi:hypothetical protein